MLHALLLLAAEEASEPSKVPFFIAGGATAVWAVVLSALGLRNPSFPGGAAAARGVMAISAVLVVTAMTMAVVTA